MADVLLFQPASGGQAELRWPIEKGLAKCTQIGCEVKRGS